MLKRILIVTMFMILLTACASARPQLEAAAPAGFGGDVYTEDIYTEMEEAPARDALKSSLSEGESSERMVIKDANLSIVVEEPSLAMDAIGEMADDMGGYVVSSNLYETQTDSGVKVPRARISIRVPVQKLNEALEQIKAGAGRVLSEKISGQDVTREYTDLESRLRNLESAEEQLAEIMDEAKDTEDVLSVYNRLVEVREEIEVIQGQMQYYERSAALSSISVDIQADAAVQPLTIGGWQLVGVAKRAIQALINTLKFFGNVAIYLILLIIPVVLILYYPIRWLWKGVKRLFGSKKSKREQKNSEQQETKE